MLPSPTDDRLTAWLTLERERLSIEKRRLQAEESRLRLTRRLRSPLGPDSLVTWREIARETGWGEQTVKPWLRALPIRRYTTGRTARYRWRDVLHHLPSEEPAALPREETTTQIPSIPPADRFGGR